jgi:hypothetical protein
MPDNATKINSKTVALWKYCSEAPLLVWLITNFSFTNISFDGFSLLSQSYWYLPVWLLFRGSFIVWNSRTIKSFIKNTLTPFRDWVEEILQILPDYFYIDKQPHEVLDFLTSERFDPVVMCAAKGHERCSSFQRSDGKSVKCDRWFCRFGHKKGAPITLRDTGHIPGFKKINIALGTGDPVEICVKGKMTTWSARELAFRASDAGIKVNNIPRDAQLLIRPKWYNFRRWVVDVETYTGRNGRDSLIEAHLIWDNRNNPDYRTCALAYPLCSEKSIDKENIQEWLKKMGGKKKLVQVQTVP